MKTKLTLEASARLIELGVDAELASEREFVDKTESNPNQFLEIEEYFLFTLADLLSILPKEINHQCLTICSTDKRSFAFYGSWEKEYIHSWQETVTPNDDCGKNPASELIDALYQLLIWAIENGYVIPNKDNRYGMAMCR